MNGVASVGCNCWSRIWKQPEKLGFDRSACELLSLSVQEVPQLFDYA